VTIFPASFSAGLNFDKTAILTAYPAPDWSLSAILRGPSAINFTSQPVENAHRLLVSAAETAGWTPGAYTYSLRATCGDDVVEVETGQITIKPDLASAQDGFDGRHHVQKVLDNIEAVLEKRATIDQERYKINNRELWRTPISELLALRDRYRAELRRMKAAGKGGAGLFDQAVRVRFR
jgi:enamine deaminase RidA (YjgF/YER057c/UK114 family)